MDCWSRNFKDRFTPPLQFYVIAPFLGLLGESNFVCRLPSALCGIATVGIILHWIRKFKLPALFWCGAAILLLTNASFYLFFRQCRYYGLATMLTVAIAYSHMFRKDSFWSEFRLSLLLAALLTAQYLDYAAVVCCLACDYLVWGRRQPLRFRGWFVLLMPQLLVGGIVCSIWNPLHQQAGVYHSSHWVTDRLYLLWWNWRDLIKCDFAVWPLLIACPLLYFQNRSQLFLRAPLALAVFIAAIAAVVPTSLDQAHNGEVRYLAPAVPLCIGIAMIALWGLQFVNIKLMRLTLAVALCSITIETTSTQGAPYLGSTALQFYHELLVPQVESYTPVIGWINDHVTDGVSIYIEPQYKMYPLMFRAGEAVYAWQLTDPPRADFQKSSRHPSSGKNIARLHDSLRHQLRVQSFEKAIRLLATRQIHYKLIQTLPYNWKDWYRPEIIWRSFQTAAPHPGELIYIYQRQR